MKPTVAITLTCLAVGCEPPNHGPVYYHDSCATICFELPKRTWDGFRCEERSEYSRRILSASCAVWTSVP